MTPQEPLLGTVVCQFVAGHRWIQISEADTTWNMQGAQHKHRSDFSEMVLLKGNWCLFCKAWKTNRRSIVKSTWFLLETCNKDISSPWIALLMKCQSYTYFSGKHTVSDCVLAFASLAENGVKDIVALVFPMRKFLWAPLVRPFWVAFMGTWMLASSIKSSFHDSESCHGIYA